MGILDAFLINGGNISKGFEAVTKGYKYIVARDSKGEVVSFIMDTGDDHSRVLIEKYLELKGMEKELIKFESEYMKKNSQRYMDIIDKKICLLDKELMLYGDIKKAAETTEIKGFTGKIPKQGFNVYKKI